ncbi:MAG: zf-HC2 domain-containing protein [Ardenticatenaceae bacterium]|nr:zf-HC2 domain-containing protein [Ardenticatenaceae bacterium]
MEHETFFALMMDALDGELADDGRSQLESHLRACPHCLREWQALSTIDTLFRQTPALRPAADFAQRTIALLPNRRLRLWTMGVMYIFLLLSGIAPLVLGGIAYSLLRPAFSQPNVWESVSQSVEKIFQVIGTVLNALFISAGEFIIQNPATIGWLLVMIGIVSLWGGVFQQLIIQPRQISS